MKHACALARSENSVAFVFAVKCGLVPRERLHDWIRDVVSAFVTIGITAANHEQRRRMLDHDATHVFRLRKAALGAIFDRQRKARGIGDRAESRGASSSRNRLSANLWAAGPCLRKLIHWMFHPYGQAYHATNRIALGPERSDHGQKSLSSSVRLLPSRCRFQHRVLRRRRRPRMVLHRAEIDIARQLRRVV